MSALPDVIAPAHSTASIPIVVEPEMDAEAEERGRLKRRRLASHSPRRASSPSRGHDRNSGSRYRQHHRKHHRPSSDLSSTSPPTSAQKKTRRRSDAEPDHTFRGRARNRSGSRRRTRSPILEHGNAYEDVFDDDDERDRLRKRSAPPSRPRMDGTKQDAEVRRQRSYPNLYKEERRDSKAEDGHALAEVGKIRHSNAT